MTDDTKPQPEGEDLLREQAKELILAEPDVPHPDPDAANLPDDVRTNRIID